MKTILVTGAAGFLGSNLSERLIKEGFGVVGVDNLLTGRQKNIADLDKAKFKFINTDIAKSLPDEVCEQDYSAIFNMACPASPPFYQSYPVETLRACSDGVLNLLELAKKQAAVFLQASTSEIYGDPLVHPQTESYWGHVNPYGPRAMYDEGKRFAEAAIWVYNQKGVDTRIFRIFNTYGPMMRPDDGRVITAYISEALKGEPLPIFGDGEQTRSFCFVDDLVEGLVKFLNTKTPGPINLGNPGEFTMNELAKLVVEITGSESGIVHKPLPANDPKQRKPDITKAKDVLGWEPKIKLEEGLKKTVDYLKGEI